MNFVNTLSNLRQETFLDKATFLNCDFFVRNTKRYYKFSHKLEMINFKILTEHIEF